MVARIKHKFQSSKADRDVQGVVRPSDWNAEHEVEFEGTLKALDELAPTPGVPTLRRNGGAAVTPVTTFGLSLLSLEKLPNFDEAAATAKLASEIALAAASGNGVKYETLPELDANTTALSGEVYGDNADAGLYARTTPDDPETPWFRYSTATTTGLASDLEATKDDLEETTSTSNQEVVNRTNLINSAPPVSKWTYSDTDSYGRLRFGYRNDEFWLPGLGHKRDGSKITTIGPIEHGSPEVLSVLMGQPDPSRTHVVVDVHGRILFAVGNDGIVTPWTALKYSEDKVSIIGPTHDGSPELLKLLSSYDHNGFEGSVDAHTRVISGTFVGGATYPLPAPDPNLPVFLNPGALRHVSFQKGRLRAGLTVNLPVGIIGDSFTQGGFRWLRGGAYRGLFDLFGDKGAGWVSFVNGNIRSQSNEYDLTGPGSTSDAYWQVNRRNTGNNSPDICSLTPLQNGAALSLQAPADSVPVNKCDFYYNAAAACTIRYRWNGGSWTSIVLDTSGGPKKVSLTGWPGTSGWLLEIEVVSGATELYGLYLTSSSPGIILSAMATGGASTSSWLDNDAALWKQGIALLGITTWFIMLATNDQPDTSPTQFIENLVAIKDRLRDVDPACDVCFLLPPDNFHPDRHGTNPMATYEAKVREYCATDPSVAALIMQTACGAPGGDYASDGAFPLWDSDDVHPEPTAGGYVMSGFFNQHVFGI